MGGHGVDGADIESRYQQSFENLLRILPMCNLVAVYDNTDDFRRFAIFKDGQLARKSHMIPEWYENLVSEGIEQKV